MGGFSTVGIDYDTLRKVLREELDIHSAFTWEKFLREGLDAHFNARIALSGGTNLSVKASNYWVQTGYNPPFLGYVTLPAGNRVTSIYSKHAFSYPLLSVRVQLPDWTNIGEGVERDLYFGFENGCGAGNGLTSFVFVRGSTNADAMYCFVFGDYGKRYAKLNITSLLPSDYKTAIHVYTVKVARQLALFSIDSNIVAIILFTPNFSYNANTVVTANPPYGIACVPCNISQFLTSLIELYALSALSVDLSAPLSPYSFRLSDGDPIQPLALPLYVQNTSTKLAQYSISSGSVSSHPIPVFGYERKTLLFMANQAGTLNIEALTSTGNWRTYDSVSVSANTLLSYKIAGDVVLARATFTPSTYPATVLEADAYMS